MAFQPTVNATLTASQNELTSKIGSMKNLLSLGFRIPKNVPKDQQISTFDYLVKILRLLGIDPQIVFLQFIDLIFDEAGNFLENQVITAVGASLDAKGIKLSNERSNADVIAGAVPATFLQTAKEAMAKQLVMMIFGPKDGSSSVSLVPDPEIRNRAFADAVCGSNMFTLSNNPTVRNEDLEYNRVRLKEQLEKGEVQFEINCQSVKIKLPKDPSVFFGSGGPNTQTSRPITPAQSVNQVINYVANQTQNINNEENAKSAGKSFSEILIGKLMSYISTMVFPYVGPIFDFLATQPETSQLTPENVLYNNCAIESNPRNNEQKAFSSSLMNNIYIALLRLLLLLVIREFKKLVSNYFATTAREKARRKGEKLRAKFSLMTGGLANAADAARKASRYAQAARSLQSILGSGTSGIPS